MKEELIRVEDGRFQSEGSEYQFDLMISRGECIGIYVDEHVTSGTAFLDIFKGYSHIKAGKVFLYGLRAGSIELERWITQNSMIADKFRFDSKELTVCDFVIALGKPIPWKKSKYAKWKLLAKELKICWNRWGCFRYGRKNYLRFPYWIIIGFCFSSLVLAKRIADIGSLDRDFALERLRTIDALCSIPTKTRFCGFDLRYG